MSRWILLLAVLLMGCSSDPEPVVVQHSLTIKADAAINPSKDGVANPVVIRLYQLTDAQMYKQLPFIDLYNSDVSKLGANLISKQVLPVVLPGSESKITLDVNKNTQYLAMLVEFSDYQQSEAKGVATLPQNDDQYLQLTINGSKATLELITPDSSWWQIF